ncbi:hypothetical protein FLSA109164_13085 [Flavobacterium saliperosum]|uniref:Uncharacterized protein n=2 Tax=Flavobacterium saliperosum TaxID=329186 RepID=A0A1G4V550_9FLAO|nr:hypothetical protein SAMN02927925_00318 [Flavobacterium saliperosum]
MRGCSISLNQLADFSQGSDAKKRNIIKQQKTPNSFKIAFYQMPRARFKKAIANKGDIQPILDGMEELKRKTLTKKRQVSDRMVSLEAMQRFCGLQIPNLLKEYEYSVLKKVESKSIFVNGVEVIVSPDLIIEIVIDNVKYLGAVKIHISKGNTFDRRQQVYIACALNKYLETEVAKNGEIVLPELCISIDVFGDGIVASPQNISNRMKDIEVICEEVKQMWDAA